MNQKVNKNDGIDFDVEWNVAILFIDPIFALGNAVARCGKDPDFVPISGRFVALKTRYFGTGLSSKISVSAKSCEK